MKIRMVNPEVYYTDESISILDKGVLDMLWEKAKTNPRKRIRLCTHENPEDKFHEMFIMFDREAYIQPHKHTRHGESNHIIHGQFSLVLYDELGNVTRTVPMGEYNSGLPFYYRFPMGVYHSVIVQSDFVLIHEGASGPFDRSEMIVPNWAPSYDQPDAVNSFLAKVRQKIK